jgi:hypothetical protein
MNACQWVSNRDASNPAAADLRLGLHGYWDGLSFGVFNCACSSTVGTVLKFYTSVIKVKVTVEQATKTQRGRRGIALFFP